MDATTVVQDSDSLLDKLLRKRAGYAEELTWHRFLLDSYAGTGGFQGRVRLPFASFWGWAADAYAESSSTSIKELLATEQKLVTYLDRYPREDMEKFTRRHSCSQYVNLVEPVIDVRLSYLNRKAFTYEGAEDLFEGDDAWSDNVGAGRSWEVMQKSVVRPRVALLGWMPMLVDAPAVADAEVVSVAQARELGVRAQLTPLFPADLWDWSCNDDGSFAWAKVGRTYHERETPFDAGRRVTEVSVWYPDRVDRWRIIQTLDAKGAVTKPDVHHDGSRTHNFGRVPLVIYRARPSMDDDHVTGLSMVASVAPLGRKLFNYLSELDEHLRSSTFAMLQVPVKDSNKVGEVVGGSSNALPVHPDSSRDFKWISPDGSVADVYENRIKAVISEARKVARMEFISGNPTAAPQSGVSQAYEFEATNRAIADFAGNLALAEQATLQLVAIPEGISEEDAAAIRVTPPTTFDVEQMGKSLEEAMVAQTLGLGSTAMGELKKRVARQLLPNLDEDVAATIDDEIDAAQVEAEQAAAAMEEAQLEATRNPPAPGEEPDDDEEDGDPPAPKPGQRAAPPARAAARPGARTARKRPGKPGTT